MHEHVVQAVHGVDVAQHLPQLAQRTTVGRRNGRGLVVPERRTGGATQAHRRGQHRDNQRVQRQPRRPVAVSLNTPPCCQKLDAR